MILDPAATQVGFVTYHGRQFALYCKKGRYYYFRPESFRSFPIGRAEATLRFQPMESSVVN